MLCYVLLFNQGYTKSLSYSGEDKLAAVEQHMTDHEQ